MFALSEQGLFIHTEEEGQVKRRMIQQGKQVIALADQTKLNKTGLFKIWIKSYNCVVKGHITVLLRYNVFNDKTYPGGLLHDPSTFYTEKRRDSKHY